VTTPRRNLVDLHTHSARSDGVLEPAQLYAQMRAWGSTLVAVTDHDTLAGARELLAAGLDAPDSDGPRILVGVEINTAVDEEVEAVGGSAERLNELHILGLGVDPEDSAFEAVLELQRGGRERRIRLTLERLRDLGMDVEASLPVVEGGIDSMGRPHVARALVATGHADDVNDAFARYLVPGQPGYVRRQGIGPRAAIEAINAAGGVASLAHSHWAPDEPAVMAELERWGLRGLEVHYHHWDEERIGRMGDFADAQGLLRTGGSDFHGDSGDYAEGQAAVHVPPEVGQRLLAALDLR
jgi:predicted metal-dependent phosphoesterase TrpH